MSSKEHCHGCGKLWSEESSDCVFNYHKKPIESKMTFPDYDTWSRLTASSKLLPEERAKIHQEISSEHEIVERLKAVLKYNKLQCDCGCHGDLEVLKWIAGLPNKIENELLKSILENK